MPKVCILEFDKDKRVFQMLEPEMELASIPTANDKVVLDIDGIGYVFKVYDVHYAENKSIDVNVIRISTITDYNSSDFPDIDIQYI